MSCNLTRALTFLLTSGVIFITGNACALDVPVKITGTIFIPPCTINNGNKIEIDFGKISLQKVDGNNFYQSKTLSVNCAYYQGIPYVKISGVQLPGAGENILQTNASGVNALRLGIALYQGSGVSDSNKLMIGGGSKNYGFPITRGLTDQGAANSQFTFTAVPYKHGGDDLSAGEFKATASISIIYI